MTRVPGTIGLVLVFACLLPVLAACDQGGGKRDLSFEVAAELASGSACEGSLTEQLEPCTSVEVFRVDGDRRAPVRLFRLDDEVRDDTTGGFKLRFDERDIAFDAEELTAEDVVDLEIRVFDDAGVPIYGATLEDVQLSQGQPLRVRLYPFQRWACPGTTAEGAAPAPRALHAAVPLSNGDVLIFGGVTGTDIDPASVRSADRKGALLQRAVELYDASAHRFRRLSGADRQGRTGFGRALFGTAYLGPETNAEGRTLHRVRVIGGWELPAASEGSSVVRFDNTGTGTTDMMGQLIGPHGAPVRPSLEADVGDPVDLLFDPDNSSFIVEDAAPTVAIPRGAAVTASRFLGEGGVDDTSLVLIGLAKPPPLWAAPAQFHLLERDGRYRMLRALRTGRLGATVEPLPAFGSFFIWGGNVGEPSATANLLPGEIQFEDTSFEGIAVPPDGLPQSTAFHTSTPMLGRDDLFLIAGGYLVDPASGFVLDQVSGTPLVALQAVARDTIVARDVAANGYLPTILHTATRLGPEHGVLLVGGAQVELGNRLAPVAQVGSVVDFAYQTLTHEDPLGAVVPTSLDTPRWGHTATLLPGDRLLVLGGFTRDIDSGTINALEAVSQGELMYYRRPPPPLLPGQCGQDERRPSDAGVEVSDAALPPLLDGGPPLPTDGGPVVDAGDAGPAADAGPAVGDAG